MDNPFFRRYWDSPFHPGYGRSSARGFPVHGVRTAPSPKVMPVRPAEEAKPSEPRVVTIPVHFVGSNTWRSGADSALKIQKVFRGFLVRKNVRKIATIGKEVDEIQKLISKNETVDLIRRDQKERVRINEMLMNLLFKLDSVTGVDPRVRELRKAVIKKAISLQEALDAIVAGGGTPEAVHTDGNKDGVDEPVADRSVEVVGTEENSIDEEMTSEPNFERIDKSDAGKLTADGEEASKIHTTLVPETAKNDEESPDQEILHGHEEKFDGVESASLNRTESQTDSSADPDTLMEVNETAIENEELREENPKNGICEGRDLKSIELFQKMREENQRMTELLAKLCEKNEMQMRMLRSLSQRVDQLEKASLMEKSNRRKKKKQATAAAVEMMSPEKSPDAKKSESNR